MPPPLPLLAALYFSWLGFYTSMLWMPAIVGILVMLYGIGNYADRTVRVDRRGAGPVPYPSPRR